MCFTVASDNVHLCHVSKLYCSVFALVRKVYDQIGRHGSSRGCYSYCSMCLACGYDARAEKACCIVVCFVGSIMYTYLIHFHPVRGVRTGWRRDIASVFLIVNTLAFYLGNCLVSLKVLSHRCAPQILLKHQLTVHPTSVHCLTHQSNKY